MPFNGSGTYIATALPGSWNPATTGSSATPADWNTLLADLSTALSTTITKDGQTTVTANIPMATHKFTGLGTGTAATDSVNLAQVWYAFGSQTPAAQSFVDFTNIPATVRNIELVWDVVVSANGATIGMQFYDSGGVLDASAIYTTTYAQASSDGTIVAGSVTAATSSLMGGPISNGTVGLNGTANINNLQSATKQTALTFQSGYVSSLGINPIITLAGFGRRTVVGPITGVRMLVDTGTFTGAVSLYASNT